jgi:regulatory protein YycH of two-component signal transduction system YycFG
MMERVKTGVLVALVALSLLQSYLLAYSMPGLVATVRSDLDYVNAEKLGTASHVEKTIFPEELIIHMGQDRHTVLYPNTQFYEMILEERLMGREFKGFQRSPITLLDWNEVRKNDIGIELRFGSGIAVDLLQKLLKLEGDLLFLNDRIDRIWIFKTAETEEIRTFFFSSEEGIVYESVRADLTVRDVQDYVGFGQHLPEYTMTADDLYMPKSALQATSMVFPYDTYSPEQMQRSLFFDASTTRAIVDRSGSQIFADGKRGLQVDQNGLWINYTNPAATQSSEVMLSENVYASVDFINQHGGWDGPHALIGAPMEDEKKQVTFRKYVEQYPIIENEPFQYGNIQLTLQQGVVTEYSRSLITLADQSESRAVRWLPGGKELEGILQRYARRGEVTAMFPALRPLPLEDDRLSFDPVWAVRFADGTEEVLTEAYPSGFTPPSSPPEGAGEGQAEGGQGAQGGEGETAVGDGETANTTGDATALQGGAGLEAASARTEAGDSATGMRTDAGAAGSGVAGKRTDAVAGLAGIIAERFDEGAVETEEPAGRISDEDPEGQPDDEAEAIDITD